MTFNKDRDEDRELLLQLQTLSDEDLAKVPVPSGDEFKEVFLRMRVMMQDLPRFGRRVG